MPEALDDVRIALADLADDDMEVLFTVARLRSAASSTLLAWIEHAVDWEQNRRKGFDFRLESPFEAMDASSAPAVIAAAIALYDQFAQDPAIARFFAAAVDLLGAEAPG